jgi:hypothetical protein
LASFAILDHHGTCPDDASFADADALNDRCTGTNVGTVANGYFSTEGRAGSDMSEVTDAAVVVDRGSRIQDGAVADLCAGLDDDAGHQHGSVADGHVVS